MTTITSNGYYLIADKRTTITSHLNSNNKSEASKFRMDAVDPSTVRDITLGIFNRGKPIEDIRIVKITLADENNLFPGAFDDRQ